MDPLAAPAALARALAGGALGLVAGSFVATLIARWPQGQSLGGRSRCPGCGAPIAAHDLIPLVAFIRLKGRCRTCGAAIPRLYPAIEGVAALMGAAALAATPGGPGVAGALMGWLLLALACLDARHWWLPDRLTWPLLALGLAAGPAPLGQRLAAVAIAGGGLSLLRLGYRHLKGREGMGLGDVKLAAAIASWLSPMWLAPFMGLAALLGLMAVARRPATRVVPFGACLAVAGWATWLAATLAGHG